MKNEECKASVLVSVGLMFALVVYVMHNNGKISRELRAQQATIKSQEETIVQLTADLIKQAHETEYAEGWKAELRQKYPGAKL